MTAQEKLEKAKNIKALLDIFTCKFIGLKHATGQGQFGPYISLEDSNEVVQAYAWKFKELERQLIRDLKKQLEDLFK